MRGVAPNPRVPNGQRHQPISDTGWSEVKSKRQRRAERRNRRKDRPPPKQTTEEPLTPSTPPTPDGELLHLKGVRSKPAAVLKLKDAVRTSNGEIAVQPMVDSGASGIGFVDPTFVAKCGATVQPSSHRIALADGSVVRATGEVELRYALASKSGPGPALQFTSTFVVTALQPYEMILLKFVQATTCIDVYRAQSVFPTRETAGCSAIEVVLTSQQIQLVSTLRTISEA